MGEHAESTEFGTKLVIDDEATEALHKVKEGFEGVSEKVHEVVHDLADFAKQAAAVAVGFEFDRGLDSLKELGEEVFDAAQDFGRVDKAIASVLAMNDKAGRSFQELKEDATELHENLEGMAVDLGASSEATIEAFEQIASRSSKSSEDVKELVGDMIYAGRAVPGGLDQIASAYRDLETGIVRPRNAIVQLIKQSGLAGGSVRDIAKGMSQLMEKDPSKAFELADRAIQNMAAKTKDLPLTFGGLTTSLKDLREQLFTAMGQPLLQALVGPLTEVRKYLVDNREKFGEMAHELGVKVGDWVKEAAHKVEQGFEYLRTHATEIADAIERGVHMAKEVVDFILAHKEEIAIAYGVKTVAPIVGGAVSAAKGAMAVGGTLANAANIGVPMLGIEGASVGAVAALGALAAGIAGAAAVAWSAKTIYDDVAKFTDEDSNARMDALKKAAEAGNVSATQLQQWRDALVLAHPELAVLANHLVEVANAARSVHEAQAADAKAAVSKLTNAAGNDASVQVFHDVFARMKAAHNQEQMKFLASFLATHQEVLDAMHKANVDLTDVGDDLAKSFESIGQHMLGVEVGGIVDAQKKALEKGKTPNGLTYNFNGGQTFNIKQDFRDADPDRVALIFRRDILKAAAARTQSRFAPAFGL
jgi:ABC-type transporter Mla subunit MlaD